MASLEQENPNIPEKEQKKLGAWLRRITDPAAEATSQLIIDTIPGVTANQISVAGGLIFMGGTAALALQRKRGRSIFWPTVAKAAGLAGDRIDGWVAKLIAKRDGLTVEQASPNGQNVDVIVDIIEETISSTAQAVMAKDKLGKILAAATIVANQAPRYLRALAQERGYEMKDVEMGKKIPKDGSKKEIILTAVAKIGSRGPRAGLQLVGELGGKKTRNVANALLLAGDAASAYQRLRIANGQDPDLVAELSDEERVLGRERKKFIRNASVITGITGMGVIFIDHAINKRASR